MKADTFEEDLESDDEDDDDIDDDAINDDSIDDEDIDDEDIDDDDDDDDDDNDHHVEEGGPHEVGVINEAVGSRPTVGTPNQARIVHDAPIDKRRG